MRGLERGYLLAIDSAPLDKGVAFAGAIFWIEYLILLCPLPPGVMTGTVVGALCTSLHIFIV